MAGRLAFLFAAGLTARGGERSGGQRREQVSGHVEVSSGRFAFLRLVNHGVFSGLHEFERVEDGPLIVNGDFGEWIPANQITTHDKFVAVGIQDNFKGLDLPKLVHCLTVNHHEVLSGNRNLRGLQCSWSYRPHSRSHGRKQPEKSQSKNYDCNCNEDQLEFHKSARAYFVGAFPQQSSLFFFPAFNLLILSTSFSGSS